MDTRAQLLRDVDAFLAGTGIAESTFGKMAVRDGKFVRRLRSGKNITLTTVERVQRFMAEHRSRVEEAA